MNKSQLISLIQQLPSVVTVEPIHISPEEPDELLCLITFLPVEIPEILTIQEISKRNYEATKRRGLINECTTLNDFLDKIKEETNELELEATCNNQFDRSELADIALVCFAMAEHYEIDLVKEMELKTRYNEVRK